ncbi:MAG: XdhC family protein [Brasilonema octagenarum HA4186-MV1]|jgi:xanthine/CO dehydrogenase XdhC/CoxF family maturation factor|uniref:XdhC/CoxI family protein n=2 Tax=Brasilonema TaxID=383614 RepID=A0A856MI24_9CYAN|nr:MULTISPECIES: XdhC/CoxI family protein [Brasilonema]MBW4627353.1 XdhC family protein [Brasilonema octagenarum HA4186-MV1]NMF64011.1 XdhC/CoxI family protein [Brasilonema octagenarum UFV-OR1]QDL09281.1 XdhC/CoxI family protein [Brasilonema sennae CENA114]QDL15638.1 XdhC/CoxI family protein [Brasilonema octagenarum UFV-E1]
MNELQAILTAFESSQKSGDISFLATVVKTQGSTYRRPGAKMLMTGTGQIVGTISAGCLENDVFEYTRQRMADGKPIVVTYDNTASEDILWGFGLGCNGVVQVLIERLENESTPNAIAFIKECLNNKHLGIIATVFASEGAVDLKLGSRLLLYPNSKIITDIEDANLTQSLIADAQAALVNQKSSVNNYQLPFGSAEVFIEVIQPPTPLVIFGAGYDAVPVAQFAEALGWQVTVVDCRANEATRARFPMTCEVILSRREILEKQVFIDTGTVTVVMTHNYLDDLEIMKTLLPSPARYIGVLGPKHRTEKLLQDLEGQGIVCTTEQLERLHSPVGIDIGAETPAEIAIAIIAEIQAVLKNHNGGFLRNRNQPIHQYDESNFNKLLVKVG